jgi:creatinine amidohydrolase/Fe(II)-dependent formamide hydrolase-like protein
MRPVIFALVCVLGLSVTPETIVLIPLGADSKEHGPHLQLRNDLTLAEYLTELFVDATSVVVAPAWRPDVIRVPSR